MAIVAAGMGALWWRHLRPPAARALASVFDGDAEVALHVASHEARTRNEPLSSLHVLYGLIQDETIATAIRGGGGDVSALEDRVLAALDARPHPDTGDDEDDGHRVYSYAASHAHHANRRAGVVDLWAYLRVSDAAALLADAEVARVLFWLCHGEATPLSDAIGTADVHVVLRNDDYTTQELVCEVLTDVFGLPSEEAIARMLETHTTGRAIAGRYRPAEARDKILEVRARARQRGFPLWIGLEPI